MSKCSGHDVPDVNKVLSHLHKLGGIRNVEAKISWRMNEAAKIEVSFDAYLDRIE